MESFVGITDFEWYSHLRQKGFEEVNFWLPSGNNLLNPPPGAPFFFKLRASHGSQVVGFGHFAWRSRLPAWMAWDTFGEANGAATREDMLRRIGRLRKDPVIDYGGKYEIGCLLISQPTFFDRPDWVAPPRDWPANVQRGKSYSLGEGEGLRLYAECRERASRLAGGLQAPAYSPPVSARYGAPRLVQPRLGQAGFKLAVADAYQRRCAVSTEHSLPALDAAHIRGFAEGGPNEIRNGILLRADIHRLFDRGFVTVTPEYQFKVSRRLRDDYSNGRVYYELQESLERSGRIHLPADKDHYPDPDALAWHVREKFAG